MWGILFCIRCLGQGLRRFRRYRRNNSYRLVARFKRCGTFMVSCLSLLLCSVAGGNTQPNFKSEATTNGLAVSGVLHLTVSCLSLLLCSVAGGNTQPSFANGPGLTIGAVSFWTRRLVPARFGLSRRSPPTADHPASPASAWVQWLTAVLLPGAPSRRGVWCDSHRGRCAGKVWG